MGLANNIVCIGPFREIMSHNTCNVAYVRGVMMYLN